MTMPSEARVKLWDAINTYTVECGGVAWSIRTDRQRAVTAVEEAIEALVAELVAERSVDHVEAPDLEADASVIDELHDVLDAYPSTIPNQGDQGIVERVDWLAAEYDALVTKSKGGA